jgi:hypothetical protein
VKLPQETVLGEDGKIVSNADFARVPLPLVFDEYFKVASVETTTTRSAHEFKLDICEGKTQLPSSIDVYLPGKVRSRVCFRLIYFIFVYYVK